ncbi:MAG: PAS domain S-box protein, partial [Promethearchaeota archaeon]
MTISLEECLHRKDVPNDVKDLIKKEIKERNHIEEVLNRKKTVEAHRETHQLLEIIFDNTPILLAFLDSQFNFLKVNRAYAAADEREPSFFPGKNHFDLYPDEENETIFREVVKTGKAYFANSKPFEYTDHPEHGVSYWDWSLIPIKDPNHQVFGLVFSLQDVTDQIQLETQLIECEEKNRNLVERANDGIAIIQDEILKFVNQQMAEMLNYSVEEMLNTPCTKYVHPSKFSELSRNYKKCMAGQSFPLIYESKLLMKDGSVVHVELSGGIITYQGKPADLVIVRNITERKIAEEELVLSDEILKQMPDGVLLVDLKEQKIQRWMGNAEQVFGYNREEVIGKPVSFLHHPDVRETMEADIIHEIEEKGEFFGEIPCMRKDGSVIPIELTATTVYDKDGNPLATIGINKDISERKKIEKELFYKSFLLDNVSDAVIATDMDFKIKSWNKAAETIYGWKEQEVLGKEMGYLTDTEYPFNQKEDVINQFMKKGGWRGEVIQKRKDKTSLDILASVSLLKDETGLPIGALGVNRDITSLKQTERALRESESRYRSFVENFHGIAFRGDRDFVPEFFQGAVEDITGYTENDFLLGKISWDQIIYPEDHSRYLNEIEKPQVTSKNQTKREYRIVHKDGQVKWVNELTQILFNETGENIGAQGTIYDITERKQAELGLQKEHENLLNILNTMEDGVYIVNQHREIEFINKALEKEFGVVEGRKCHQYFHKSTQVCSWCKCQDVFKGYTVRWEWKSSITQKTYDVIDTPFKNPDGIFAKLTILRDITERIHAEKALNAEKEKYQTLVEKLHEGILMGDEKGVITFSNPRFNEMLGYSDTELIGKHESIIIPIEENDKIAKETAKRPHNISSTYDTALMAKDGNRVPVIISATPLFTDSGSYKGVLGVFTDITELKQKEKELARRQQEFLTLHRISEIPLKIESQEAIFEMIVEEIYSATDFPVITIETYDEARQMMNFKASKGIFTNPSSGKMNISVKDSVSGVVINTGHPLIATNALERPELVNETLKHLSIQTLLCVPMFIGQRIIGTVCLGHPEKLTVSELFEQWIQSIANSVALIIEHQRMIHELQITNMRLEEANRELTDFANIVSHDLKAPLRGIKAISDWIVADYNDKFDEEGKKLLQLLDKRIKRAYNLIEGILKYTRIGQTPEEKKVVNLTSL